MLEGLLKIGARASIALGVGLHEAYSFLTDTDDDDGTDASGETAGMVGGDAHKPHAQSRIVHARLFARCSCGKRVEAKKYVVWLPDGVAIRDTLEEAQLARHRVREVAIVDEAVSRDAEDDDE